jgi:hypothetical protein
MRNECEQTGWIGRPYSRRAGCGATEHHWARFLAPRLIVVASSSRGHPNTGMDGAARNSNSNVILPADGTALPKGWNGDFGTSPIYGQLSDKHCLPRLIYMGCRTLTTIGGEKLSAENIIAVRHRWSGIHLPPCCDRALSWQKGTRRRRTDIGAECPASRPPGAASANGSPPEGLVSRRSGPHCLRQPTLSGGRSPNPANFKITLHNARTNGGMKYPVCATPPAQADRAHWRARMRSQPHTPHRRGA